MLKLIQELGTKAVFDRETLRADTSNPDDKTKTAAATSPVLQSEAPINVLIVDDEPRNLTVLEAILDDPGYRLVRAEPLNRHCSRCSLTNLLSSFSIFACQE